jgi:tetratricopeptide (TPR) repeat protein
MLGGGVLVVLAAVLVHQRRRPWRPSTALGLTLAVAALLPVLQIIPIPSRTLTADRFLYLPTAGLALALAPELDRALALRRSAWLLASAAVVSLGWVTARRAAVWSDEVEFWVQSYLETPATNSAAATDLVGVLYRAGLYREALAISERERSYDDPAKRQARFNAALCLDRLGRPEEALALLRATRARHHRPDTEAEIAVLELKLGQWESARTRLTALVQAGYEPARPLLQHLPDYERARAELARVPESAVEERAKLATFLGDETTAIAAWLRATSDPGTSEATLQNALRFLVQTGDRAAIATVARRYLARHAALPPDLAGMVSERLDEIDRVTAVLPRLGLARETTRPQG